MAQVTVTSQDASGGWARAGLVVRNDLGTQGTAGYVNLAITPSNGCALSWDADGDGRFDSIELSGSFTPPVPLGRAAGGGAPPGGQRQPPAPGRGPLPQQRVGGPAERTRAEESAVRRHRRGMS